MKFSVLLPTRNRLELLKYAVETILRQDYNDWEIIVSDNFSEEDIAGYVQSLNDQRIKYYRTKSFVPVTDNWNNALYKSTGDYVVMLGDDDCIMKGYFKILRNIVEKYNSPDFIYTNAFQYAYPGVMPGFPEGVLQSYGHAAFFETAKEPFWLPKKESLEMVRQSMNFRTAFTFNMQHSLISREFINSLETKGKFFQSPYPDFYATNVMLLKAKRILICPIPLVTVGVSPKSFGFYYFNEREKEGVDFLKNLPDAESVRRLQDILLPGPDMHTSWLFAMETIKLNYGSEFDLKVNYRRYRFLQTYPFFKQYYTDKNLTRKDLQKFTRLLNIWEKIVYMSLLQLVRFVLPLIPKFVYKKVKNALLKKTNQFPTGKVTRSDNNYKNILEVFEKVDPLRDRL